jgi:hypothetical protein
LHYLLFFDMPQPSYSLWLDKSYYIFSAAPLFRNRQIRIVVCNYFLNSNSFNMFCVMDEYVYLAVTIIELNMDCNTNSLVYFFTFTYSSRRKEGTNTSNYLHKHEGLQRILFCCCSVLFRCRAQTTRHKPKSWNADHSVILPVLSSNIFKNATFWFLFFISRTY